MGKGEKKERKSGGRGRFAVNALRSHNKYINLSFFLAKRTEESEKKN